MSTSLAIFFALLVAVPGLLIPLLVLTRMYRVLGQDGRQSADKIFARAAMVGMLLLMGLSVYAALAIYARLSALAL